jgi:hypothetical protein
MRMFAGLDVGFKRTPVCVVDEAGRIVWRGVVDTHPERQSNAQRPQESAHLIAERTFGSHQLIARPQHGETDVVLGISRQGDAMARHYLYEAANVLLTTVRKPSALKSWGLKLMKRRGRKRARVAVARRLAILLGRIWKDQTHFDAVPA